MRQMNGLKQTNHNRFLPFQNERNSMGKLLTEGDEVIVKRKTKLNIKNIKICQSFKSEQDLGLIQKGNLIMYSKMKKQTYYDSNVIDKTYDYTKLNTDLDSIQTNEHNSYLHNIYKESIYFKNLKDYKKMTEKSKKQPKPQTQSILLPSFNEQNKLDDTANDYLQLKNTRFYNINKKNDIQLQNKKDLGIKQHIKSQKLVQPKMLGEIPAVGNYDINYKQIQQRAYQSHINSDNSYDKASNKLPSFLSKEPKKNISIKQFKRNLSLMTQKDPVIGEFSKIIKGIENEAEAIQREQDKNKNDLNNNELRKVEQMHGKIRVILSDAKECIKNYQSTKYELQQMVLN